MVNTSLLKPLLQLSEHSAQLCIEITQCHGNTGANLTGVSASLTKSTNQSLSYKSESIYIIIVQFYLQKPMLLLGVYCDDFFAAAAYHDNTL